MLDDQKWVERVREVLTQAVPSCRAKASGEQDLHALHQAVPPLAQTPRARLIREISWVAVRYGWRQPIVVALDVAGVATLHQLQDHELEDLAVAMRRLVDCAQHACDLEDAPPAR